MNLQTAGYLATVVVGVGVFGTGLAKVAGAMGKFNEFMRSWWGDGNHPSVPDRLATLEQKLDDNSAKLDRHISQEVPRMMADGTAWGERLDAGQRQTTEAVAALDKRVSALESNWRPAV